MNQPSPALIPTLALTVKPPMAGYLLFGKDVENRPWRPAPPTEALGPVLIHAGQGEWKLSDAERRQCESLLMPGAAGVVDAMPRGAIIGMLEFRAFLRSDDVSSPWASGPWCWMVDPPTVRIFREPIIGVRGQQQLWPCDDPRLAEAVANAETPEQRLRREASEALQRDAANAAQHAMECPRCGGVDAHTPACPLLKRSGGHGRKRRHG
jgi:hypothetical protein